jgi:hypothetical protein
MDDDMVGFKLQRGEDGKDTFAIINMHDRCTGPLGKKMKPYKVINDFKQTANSWVLPWGFDRKNQPTRAVIVSRAYGIKIDKL